MIQCLIKTYGRPLISLFLSSDQRKNKIRNRLPVNVKWLFCFGVFICSFHACWIFIILSHGFAFDRCVCVCRSRRVLPYIFVFCLLFFFLILVLSVAHALWNRFLLFWIIVIIVHLQLIRCACVVAVYFSMMNTIRMTQMCVYFTARHRLHWDVAQDESRIHTLFFFFCKFYSFYLNLHFSFRHSVGDRSAVDRVFHQHRRINIIINKNRWFVCYALFGERTLSATIGFDK